MVIALRIRALAVEIVLCFRGKHSIFTVRLFAEEYKRVSGFSYYRNSKSDSRESRQPAAFSHAAFLIFTTSRLSKTVPWRSMIFHRGRGKKIISRNYLPLFCNSTVLFIFVVGLSYQLVFKDLRKFTGDDKTSSAALP